MKTVYTPTELVNASVDAYSRPFYSDAHWHDIISFLLKEGIKPRAIIWILFSKHMRWNDPHTYTAFVKYFTLDKNDIRKDAVLNYDEDEYITEYLKEVE